jgi:hypothetical protein
MKNKCLVPLRFGRLKRATGGELVSKSQCHVHVISAVHVAPDRSTLLFIFYAKYSVEKA